jgi:hypothetical protein
MFFPALDYCHFLSHPTLVSRIVTGMVLGAAFIVAIGAAVYRPADTLSSIDANDIRLMRATAMHGTASRSLFLETDPAWYAQRPASESAFGVVPQQSPEPEASMINGHVQAF